MHGVEIRVIRIFSTYGPRMLAVDGRVVSNFIVQALKGEALPLYVDGSQTRSFCYLDDLIEGKIRLMNGSHCGPINIGNPGGFTVSQFADLGLQPTVPLEQGLEPTTAWFRKTLLGCDQAA
jgi:UDP-glucuronate decarboxylase